MLKNSFVKCCQGNAIVYEQVKRQNNLLYDISHEYCRHFLCQGYSISFIYFLKISIQICYQGYHNVFGLICVSKGDIRKNLRLPSYYVFCSVWQFSWINILTYNFSKFTHNINPLNCSIIWKLEPSKTKSTILVHFNYDKCITFYYAGLGKIVK